jgi:hypothetical protein
MNNKAVVKHGIKIYIIFGIIITLQLAGIIYYFQFRKEGYHSDEIWSYGYANSFYEKDIYQDSNGTATYINEWLDTQILKDYIVVNDDEGFRYDSVYNNQINDLSPPLHSMILHTICSFFPNTFSRWYSFAINIVSFLLCMIFIFKTARLLKDDIFALCCCGLYGFSLGARDTYIYLRMYAMCSALVMIIIYNLLRYLKRIQKEKKLFNGNLVAVCIVSFLGFLTHYYVVSFMGILTFLICLYLLCKKQLKSMLVYGFCMLITFLLSVAVFPTMFRISNGNVQNVSSSMNYNFEIRFKILSNFVLGKLFNIKVQAYETGTIRIIFGCIVYLIILMIPVLFLLRNNVAVRKVRNKISFIIHNPGQAIKYAIRKINFIYVIFITAVVCQIIVVSETSMVYGMANYIDRYLFFLYPIVVIVVLSFVYFVIYIIAKKRKLHSYLLCIISVLLIGINIYNCEHYVKYLFLRDDNTAIEDCIAGKDCIFIRNEPWMLTTLVPTLIDADEFVQVQYYDYLKLGELYKEHSSDEPIVALIDCSFTKTALDTIEQANMPVKIEKDDAEQEQDAFYNDIIQFLEDLEPDTEMELLTTQVIFERKMEVYLINP